MTVIRVGVDGWHQAAPGQFALLQTEGSSRYLPRAFSVMDQSDQEVSFLVAPIGPATAELARLRAGEGVWVLGPLGRGFHLPDMLGPCGSDAAPEPRRLVVVAGGVGLAPFPLVLRELAQSRSGPPGAVPSADVLVLLGFRDTAQARALEVLEEPILLLRRAGASVRAEVVTEDGGLGRSGLVTDLLSEELLPGDALAVCGSQAMCEAVWSVCMRVAGSAGDAGVEAWFSLEAPMACGVGSCQGCVIPLSNGGLAKVCRRGPVFRGRDVFGADAGRE
jgi:dihydroorotate dehydrogenase electron transfer subunit